jgi:hypothetical protein
MEKEDKRSVFLCVIIFLWGIDPEIIVALDDPFLG